jgi:Bacterial low temperature requirement A protein (LtrA)
VSVAEREQARDAEHQVTPLELFFDLVFVFAITQVTILLADDPTWGGVFRGMLVLAALWWAWTVYAWLTSTMDVDEGGVRLAMLGSMGAMFAVALAVPGAFGDDAVLFGVAYLSSASFMSSSPPSSLATIPTAAARCSGLRRRRSSVPLCSCSPASSTGESASRSGSSHLRSTTSARS